MNKKEIVAVADSAFGFTPPGKQQIVFIGNHDMDRFSSVMHENAGKNKIGAALSLLIGGIPSIYYGEEIGMVGTSSWDKYGMTDANGIPQREAFEWYKTVAGKGMSTWYKNTGPWWDSTNLKSNDGISLQEQKANPGSLWNFYRNIIALRENNEAFVSGTYQALQNNNDSIYSFLRSTNRQTVVVVINLSGSKQNVSINFGNAKGTGKKWKKLFGDQAATISEGSATISLPAYGIQVWEIL